MFASFDIKLTMQVYVNACSTNNLEAEPGKLDIKRHSSSILFVHVNKTSNKRSLVLQDIGLSGGRRIVNNTCVYCDSINSFPIDLKTNISVENSLFKLIPTTFISSSCMYMGPIFNKSNKSDSLCGVLETRRITNNPTDCGIAYSYENLQNSACAFKFSVNPRTTISLK